MNLVSPTADAVTDIVYCMSLELQMDKVDYTEKSGIIQNPAIVFQMYD